VLFYEAALFALVLVAALMATLLKARLAAIAALGVVGYGVALIFILFGAPDVAMTQFVVETLTVILFVLVFHHLPDSATVSRSWVRARDALLAIAVGGLMTVLAWTMAEVQFHDSIAQYYLDNSLSAAHGRNIVNVILVDFRGLDTLGEITVLAVAGVGVYALLKLQIHGKPEAHPPVPIAKQRSDAGAWAPVATSPDAGDALPPRAAGEPR
jgi:multicomponent Na+:H+ antiporter subunit A